MKINEFVDNLLSEDKEIVKETTLKIMDEGDLNIVPALFDILKNQELNHTTEAAVATILASIKDPKFTPLLKDAILANYNNPEMQAKLVRVCWESTMNYAELIPILCNLAIEGDFIVAMEATTAIEEQLKNADHDLIHDIHKELLNSDHQNSPFAEEVLALIEQAIETMHNEQEEADEEFDGIE